MPTQVASATPITKQGSGTNFNMNIPAAIGGQVCYFLVGWIGNGTITAGVASVRPIGSPVVDGSNQRWQLFYYMPPSGISAGVVTFSSTVSGAYTALAWAENNHLVDPIRYMTPTGNVNVGGTGGNTNMIANTVTPQDVEETVYFMGHVNQVGTVTAPDSTWTIIAQISSGGSTLVVARKDKAAQAATGSVTFTVSGGTTGRALSALYCAQTALPSTVLKKIKNHGVAYGGVTDESLTAGGWVEQLCQMCVDVGFTYVRTDCTIINPDASNAPNPGQIPANWYTKYDQMANYFAKYGLEWVPNLHFAFAKDRVDAAPNIHNGVMTQWKAFVTAFCKRYCVGGSYVPPSGTTWKPVRCIELWNEPNQIGGCPGEQPNRGSGTQSMDYHGSRYPQYPALIQRDGSDAIRAYSKSKSPTGKSNLIQISAITCGAIELDYIKGIIDYCENTLHRKFFYDSTADAGIADGIGIHIYMSVSPSTQGNTRTSFPVDITTDWGLVKARYARTVGTLRRMCNLYTNGSKCFFNISEGGFSGNKLVNYYQISTGNLALAYGQSNKFVDGSIGWEGPNDSRSVSPTGIIAEFGDSNVGDPGFPGTSKVLNQMQGNQSAFDQWNRGNNSMDPDNPFDYGVEWVSFYQAFDSHTNHVDSGGYPGWQDGRAPVTGIGDNPRQTTIQYTPVGDFTGANRSTRQNLWKSWGWALYNYTSTPGTVPVNNHPTVKINYPTAGLTVKDVASITVDVTVTSDDGISSVKLQINGGSAQSMIKDPSNNNHYTLDLVPDKIVGGSKDNALVVTATDNSVQKLTGSDTVTFTYVDSSTNTVPIVHTNGMMMGVRTIDEGALNWDEVAALRETQMGGKWVIAGNYGQFNPAFTTPTSANLLGESHGWVTYSSLHCGSHQGNTSIYSWKDIYSGALDALIDAWGLGYKSHGTPFWFVFHHECEDDTNYSSVYSTKEVQTLTMTGAPTGGNFDLTYTDPWGRTQTALAISRTATAAQIQTALTALSYIGAGRVVCAGGPINSAPVTVTFQDRLNGMDIPMLTVGNHLTGGTSPNVTVVETTKGNGMFGPPYDIPFPNTGAVPDSWIDNGSPADFVAAYNYFMSRWAALDISNMLGYGFVLQHNTWLGQQPWTPQEFIPNSYTFVGQDGYNKNNEKGWQTFESLFTESLQFARSVGKPIYIAECGCVEDPLQPGTRKAQWYIDAAQTIKNWDCILDIQWQMNETVSSTGSFTTSPEATAAWKQAFIDDPYFQITTPNITYDYGSGDGGDGGGDEPPPATTTTYKIQHRNHDGHPVGESAPTNLRWGLYEKSPGYISYSLNLFDPLCKAEFATPYQHDVYVIRNGVEICSGILTGANADTDQRAVDFTAATWEQYLALRILPFDPDHITNKTYTDTDMFDIVRDLINYAVVPDGVKIVMDQSKAGVTMNIGFMAADLTSILDIIKGLADQEPGFDFRIDTNKVLIMETPRRTHQSTYKILLGNSQVKQISYVSNEGDTGSEVVVSGTGSGSTRVIKTLTDSQAVARVRKITRQFSHSGIASPDQINALAQADLDLVTKAIPTLTATLILLPDDTFFRDVTVGDSVFVSADLEYIKISDYYRVTGIEGYLSDQGGTEEIVVTFNSEV